MKKNPFFVFLAFLGVIVVLGFSACVGAVYTAFSDKSPGMTSNSVGVVEVRGIILDSRAFIKTLQKYQESKDIKAVVVRLDSPGGVVGPSQEMYDEVLRTIASGKPVVASMGSLAASGAYYIAAACQKIVTNPGTITGSIGVIMEFADLSKLYNWAKVERYVIKSGQFKDIGSESRPMTAAEKSVMQGMIDNVFMQFKRAVALGRHMDMAKVSKLADGRVYSGEQAVENGLADKVGGFQDAVDMAAQMAKIKGKPEIFYPSTKRKKIWDMLLDRSGDDNDDDMYGYEKFAKRILGLDLVGRPLFLMPLARF